VTTAAPTLEKVEYNSSPAIPSAVSGCLITTHHPSTSPYRNLSMLYYIVSMDHGGGGGGSRCLVQLIAKELIHA